MDIQIEGGFPTKEQTDNALAAEVKRVAEAKLHNIKDKIMRGGIPLKWDVENTDVKVVDVIISYLKIKGLHG